MPIPIVKPNLRCVAGLTRLEIMLALTVIAVLFSVLLARLGELGGMARPGRLQSAIATVHVVAAAFHARCQSERGQSPQHDCARVEVDGVPVAGVNGWPAASAEGIASAAKLPLTGLDAFRLRATRKQGLPALSIALGESGCEFLYVQAKSPDMFPEVDIVDASCH